MRAIVIHDYGPAERLMVAEVPDPELGDSDILIRQRYAGVNFADVYMRNGLYRGEHTYGTGLPFRLGIEGAGEVVAIGANVTRFVPGDRAAYCLGTGGYAEMVAVDESKAVKLPTDINEELAAVLLLQGSTAHYLTHSLFRLGAGQTCLIHAGAGGVGQLLIQIAKAQGTRVISTVGSPEKFAVVEALGADVVVNYRQADFVEAIMSATSGEGVDVVYDSVGRDTIRSSFRCLKVRGTCVLFGASSGPVECVVPMELAEAGSIFFTRPHLAHYRRSVQDAEAQANDLFALVRRGALRCAVDSVHPLAAAVEAHRRLESRLSSGKILLRT